MIWPHLATVVWLRRRLTRNQARTSPVLALLARILFGLMLLAGAVMFLVFLAIGGLAMGGAPPQAILFVWDGFIAVFLFFWITGLMVQLQRSELIAADRFLQFPIPPRTVFAINYVGSTVLSADVVVIGSGMLGLAAGLTISHGPGMLLLVPAVLAFLLMVTGASHQLQGWLAMLMANRRRRRQVVAVGSFVLAILLVGVAQSAQIADRLVARSAGADAAEIDTLRREVRRLDRERRAGAISQDEYAAQVTEVRSRLAPLTAAVAAERRRLIETAIVPAHRWIPPGWLPYAAMTLAEGRVVPAMLGVLGLALFGALSLARSYRTTLRLYLGAAGSARPVAGSARPPAAAPPAVPRQAAAERTSRLLEWRLPWLSEHASAIAVACFRSLTRAPEARILLLTPLLMTVIFGGMFLRGGNRMFSGMSDPTVFMRPLMATGLFLLVILGLNQIGANQFGFDRDGFRVFVLSSARRRDILLGKNLALMPLALTLGVGALVVLQVFVPMRIDHFVATLAQTISIYLLYCLLANLLSIYVPFPIKPGSLRPARTNTTLTLVNLAMIFVFPFVLLPTLASLGVEAALDWWAGLPGLPLYLTLSLVQVSLVLLAYARALAWQGDLLQAREQRILEVVSIRAE